MKLSQKLEEAFNLQLNYEFTAGYFYLGLAAALDATVFTGFANWMRKQGQEEFVHAMKFYDYVYLRHGKVTLYSIAKPDCSHKTPLEAFAKALEVEKENTKNIEALYQLAIEEKDFAAQAFLGYFVKEQVEEENTVQIMLDKLTLAGDRVSALLQLNAKAEQR